MSSEKTGGPAFPSFEDQHYYQMGDKVKRVETQGMTLRDYFAAKAMQSLILGIKTADDENLLGVIAYVYADKMMEARKNA